MALLYPGSTDFEQCAPAQWQPSGWDLDRLVVPWRGSEEDLNAFIASLTHWEASTIDANMFLESWPNDGHQQFPTVNLTYIGRKGGVLPPSRTIPTYPQQQAAYSSANGKDEANVTYIAPVTTVVSWSRTDVGDTDIGVTAADPGDLIFGQGTWRSQTGASPPANAAAYIALFHQLLLTTGECEEVVPGEYFRVTRESRHMLISTVY